MGVDQILDFNNSKLIENRVLQNGEKIIFDIGNSQKIIGNQQMQQSNLFKNEALMLANKNSQNQLTSEQQQLQMSYIQSQVNRQQQTNQISRAEQFNQKMAQQMIAQQQQQMIQLSNQIDNKQGLIKLNSQVPYNHGQKNEFFDGILAQQLALMQEEQKQQMFFEKRNRSRGMLFQPQMILQSSQSSNNNPNNNQILFKNQKNQPPQSQIQNNLSPLSGSSNKKTQILIEKMQNDQINNELINLRQRQIKDIGSNQPQILRNEKDQQFGGLMNTSIKSNQQKQINIQINPQGNKSLQGTNQLFYQNQIIPPNSSIPKSFQHSQQLQAAGLQQTPISHGGQNFSIISNDQIFNSAVAGGSGSQMKTRYQNYSNLVEEQKNKIKSEITNTLEQTGDQIIQQQMGSVKVAKSFDRRMIIGNHNDTNQSLGNLSLNGIHGAIQLSLQESDIQNKENMSHHQGQFSQKKTGAVSQLVGIASPMIINNTINSTQSFNVSHVNTQDQNNSTFDLKVINGTKNNSIHSDQMNSEVSKGQQSKHSSQNLSQFKDQSQILNKQYALNMTQNINSPAQTQELKQTDANQKIGQKTQYSDQNLEMKLNPQTEKHFKRTYRHFFRRRPNFLDRPIVIINFQGVIGDFFKDNGLSVKQDQIMSKQYLQQTSQQENNLQNGISGSMMGNSSNQSDLNCMWIRIGSIDGLKYLSKHFQIIIFNRDTCFEDFNQKYSQIQMIQSYLIQNDIIVDGIYSTSKAHQQHKNENELFKSISQKQDKQNKKEKIKEAPKNMIKEPHKQGEIWQDYKQIYLDFNLQNDQKVRDRVLFIQSFDADFNSKQDEIKFDSKGFFLIDSQSKPPRPLAEGIPLSYETKDKEIDLSDKGQRFQFIHMNKNKIQVKEMPVTILIPNPRCAYTQQLSFASIAKTIITMSFLGQKKQCFDMEDLQQAKIYTYLNNLTFLQEFDIKVQKDQCLIQCNTTKQCSAKINERVNIQQKQNQINEQKIIEKRQDQTAQNGRNNRSLNSQNNEQLKLASNQKNNNQLQINKVNTNPITQYSNNKINSQSMAHKNNRPQSSNSHNHLLYTNEQINFSKNRNADNDQQQDDLQKFFDFSSIEETLVVPLKEQLFQNLSWASSFDYINEASEKREILGLVPVKSNLIWRFFLSILKQRSNIKQLRQQRVVELKNLIQKLDQLQNEEGKGKRQQQIQDIYDKLKKVQTNGNPLTNMMARNLKVFIKIYAEVKRKSKRELDNFTEALIMDQKLAELEKQNIESRIFILGANKPNLYFNTHARVYEKIQIQPIINLNIFNNTSNISNNAALQQTQYNSRLQENKSNNNESMGSAMLSSSNALNKSKNIGLQQQNNQSYNTINSNDNNNNSSQEHQNKSLMEMANNSNQKSNSKAQKINTKNGQILPAGPGQAQIYGRKKQSNAGLVQVVVGAVSGVASADTASSTVMCNFSSQSSAILSRRKTASRGGGEGNNQAEDAISRRSNQSSQDQNQRYLSTRLLS